MSTTDSRVEKAIQVRIDKGRFPAKPIPNAQKPGKVDPETENLLKPASVIIAKSQTEFQVDSSFGRDYVSKPVEQLYDALVSFQGKVDFSPFEQSMCENPIKIAADADGPSAIVTINRATYAHAPRHEGPCDVLFTFKVRLGR